MATVQAATEIPTPMPSRSERRITPYGTPMLRFLLLAAALGLAACGGEEATADRQGQARQLARDAGLGPEVEEWLALAAGAPDASYRVVYGEGDHRLVVTQREGERRVDAGQGGRAALPSDPGPFDEAAVARLVERLKASRADYTFDVEDRRMLGVTARCLVTAPRHGEGTTGTLCVSPEGALLLAEGATGELRATEYAPE